MVQAQMKKQSLAKTRIHFEMASFVDELLFNELISHVIPFADSLGMNEQELPNLHAMLKYGNISYVSDSNPRIALVLGWFSQSNYVQPHELTLVSFFQTKWERYLRFFGAGQVRMDQGS